VNDIIVRLSQREGCEVEEAKRETNMGSHDWVNVNDYGAKCLFK